VILGADYGTKVDIWAIGCMVRSKYYHMHFIRSHNYSWQTFELLTGHWLFNPVHGPTWRIEDDHLAKMMELTGEKFSKVTLARSQKRDDYFDEGGSCTVIFTLTLLLINVGSIQGGYCVLANYSLELLSRQWLITEYPKQMGLMLQLSFVHVYT
jgi:hypothetical protein